MKYNINNIIQYNVIKYINIDNINKINNINIDIK